MGSSMVEEPINSYLISGYIMSCLGENMILDKIKLVLGSVSYKHFITIKQLLDPQYRVLNSTFEAFLSKRHLTWEIPS